MILYLTQEDSNLLETMEVYIPKFVSVRICEDLGPGKKLIPALRDFPDKKIITVDDDVVYPKDLIKRIVGYSLAFPLNIIAGRAHKITLGDDFTPRQYSEWEHKVSVFENPSTLLFPTGVGIICYPPKSLHPDALDVDTYKKNCLFQDDIWFYIQAIRKGTKFCLLPGDNQYEYIPETQTSGLWEIINSSGGNDLAMQLLLGIYADLHFIWRDSTRN